MVTTVISLTEGVEELEQDIQDVREEAQQARQEYQEEHEDEDDVTPFPDTERGQQYENAAQRLRVQKVALEDALEDWGEPSEFVIKELSYGELMMARDEVSSASYEPNPQTGGYEGVPRDGLYRVKVLELAIEEVPAEAPTDPKDFPPKVGSWLYDEIDEFNTTTPEGNLDLWETEET